MKYTLLALLLLTTAVSLFAWQEQPKPTAFCTPNHKEAEHRCMCLNQDHGEGCKDGKRDVEMQSCKSYCWKDKCACCAS